MNIFAMDRAEAERLVKSYMVFNFGERIEYQIHDAIDRMHLDRKTRAFHDDAVAREEQGFGTFDPETGWNIVPVWEHPFEPKSG